MCEIVAVAFNYRRQVRNYVNLVGSCEDAVFCGSSFDVGRVTTERQTYHASNFDVGSMQLIGSQRNPSTADRDGSEIVPAGLIAELFDVVACGSGL
jgi:hypothetical protein